MSYPRGNMNKRVQLWNPQSVATQYGGKRTAYKQEGSMWAWVTITRGARSMHAGNVDVYQYRMVRCDCNKLLTDLTRLHMDGRFFVIDSFQQLDDKNEVQITCYAVDDVDTVVETES